jgi:type IV pilus assembly protein PilC
MISIADLRPRRVSGKELAFFTSQLALLLETGSSLTEALAAVRSQTANPVLRAALEQAEDDVKGGKLLSTALRQHPALFPTMFTSMVSVGETGGFLADMLQRISQFQMLRQELLSRIWAALTYPLVLLAVSCSVVIFMLTVVLPKFLKLFQGKEAILPLPTKVLMLVSHAFSSYWYLIIGGLLAAGIGAVAALRSPAGREFFDRWVLRVPVVGSLWTITIASRLLRTLGVLLESGIPLLEAISVTRQTVGNTAFISFLDDLEQNVQKGGTLGASFTSSPLFPPAIKQMVHTGEQTGNSGKVMVRMSDYYEGQIALRLKSLTAVIEPIILLVMGTVVGFIALSLFMPLFRLSRTIS